MILDFKNMPAAALKNFKGGEKQMLCTSMADDNVKIMYNVLVPGSSIGFHTHVNDWEAIYVIQGEGKFILDEGEERICAGQGHYCAKGCGHSFINDGDKDLVFFAVVPIVK